MLRKIALSVLVTILINIIYINFSFAGNIAEGIITKMSAVKQGVLIMLSCEVPDNCRGTPYNWLLIEESHPSMIAFAVLANQKRIPVTIYTDDRVSGNYGIVNQVYIGSGH